MKYQSNPKDLIIDAAKSNKEIGSSTLVITSLDPSLHKIHAAMIGDSGYMIVRSIDNNAILVFKSEEQQHSFNFPFQIGSQGDNPNKALSKSHDIEVNDIIILGTDGLFDNLYSEDILNIINKNKNTCMETLSKKIAQEANTKAHSKTFDSPFAVSARKQGYRYSGGKVDDITVIASRIIEKQH